MTTTASVPGAVASVWRRPLGAHVALLAVVLVALAPFLQLDETFVSDEGSYAIQARDLDDGHWVYRYRLERYDPENRWVPLANGVRTSRGSFAYVQHPAYSILLVTGIKVAGDTVGPHLPALLGALGLAVAAWLLAAEVDPKERTRRVAFWVAATGPVSVNAYILWAHALSAAVAGLMLLAAVRLAKEFRLSRVLLLGACSAAGVLLRPEGLLFAVAIACGLVTVGLRARPWALRVAIPLLCLGSAAGAALLEQWWKAHITGEAAPIRGAREALPLGAAGAGDPGRWFRGRAGGAFHSLFSGAESQFLAVAVVVALCLLAYAAHACRRRRRGWELDITVALVVAGALYGVRALWGTSEDTTGLLAAWPLAVLGLAALSRTVTRTAKLLALVGALMIAAVLAIQYRIGGGVEWGGRYLSPVLCPLAVLASVGLGRIGDCLPSLPRGRRRAAAAALGALAVIPSATGLVLVATERSRSGALIDEVTAGGSPLVVTDVVALPRAAWRTHPDVAWMLVPASELGRAVSALREGGARRVTLVASAATDPAVVKPFPAVEDVTGPVARGLGQRTIELSSP